MDPTKLAGITVPNKYKTSASSSTALSPGRGEKGAIVFASKPKIIVCDLSLHPNQSATCKYCIKPLIKSLKKMLVIDLLSFIIS